ncbi:glycosyltransferase family 4 protein [Mesorhizobium sp. ASY16-5R]|uniref:glycosyltransferase family 4 protein n=1 Tax=Mesorhizobium sp. ASY16-5R TaxID=3445772 RepID=UPI003FA07961
MRIAQIAPLHEPVPPPLYGGTERIVSSLTEELVARGHEVTLFASGESRTSAKLAAGRERSLRLDPAPLKSEIAAHLSMLDEVRRRAGEFDVLHFHLSHFQHFPFFEHIREKTVTTPHGRLDYVDLPGAYRRWPGFPMISISMRQRKPLPEANWVGNVYHGLPLDHYRMPEARERGEKPYLAFLGRLSRDKRPDRAIEIARRSGMQLRIAAKIGAGDRAYFHDEIEPLIDGERVVYLGEVGEEAKAEFLHRAAALLFPIDWPEPFGLVVIEAMAFGTPVIAWREGAMPEIVDEGVTGFVVDSIDAAVERVGLLGDLDRAKIRRTLETRFSVPRMVDDYEAIYEARTAVPDTHPTLRAVAGDAA